MERVLFVEPLTGCRVRLGFTEMKYGVILRWSADDEAIIAEVPELPGCAADGETYQAALSNVEVIIDEWIETAQSLGRAIPEPRGRLVFA